MKLGSSSRRRLMMSACIVLAVFAFVATTTWLDGAHRLYTAPWSQAAWRAAGNALPGLLLAWLLLALTRRLLLAFGIAFVVETIVYTLSHLKEKYLDVPLLPNDFYMLGQLHAGRHLFDQYLPNWWLILIGLVLIGTITLMWRIEPPILTRSRAARVPIGIVALILLGTCITGNALWGTIYNRQRMTWAPWNPRGMRGENGLIGNLVFVRVAVRRPAQHPKPEDAQKLLAKLRIPLRKNASHNPDAPLPDIIVVQSESLFDPAQVNGFNSHGQILPNLNAWRKQAAHGKLFVPTFGGMTIRTEFETLTGLPLRYFPGMTYPYLQVQRGIIPSIVNALEAHGYRTIALHPNSPDFWNRGPIFKAMGFDRFISLDKFSKGNRELKVGDYLADSEMTDELLETLPSSGCPVFLFAVSIEGHGPYNSDKGLNVQERKRMPVPARTPAANVASWQRYLLRIRDADQQLGRLVNALKQRGRPVLVLFYGDHLPGLNAMFRATGFVDGKPLLQEPGTWILIDPMHPQPQPERNVAAWMLPGMLLARAGIHDAPYFVLTRRAGPVLADRTHAIGAKIPPLSNSASVGMDRAMRNAALVRLRQSGDVFDIPEAPAASPICKAAR